MTSLNLRRLAAAAATFSLSFTAAAAINSAAIVSSTLSPQCLEYKVVGICYWLLCGPHGCKVKTSVKVRHYVPDAVVSSYANTGSNPWTEVSALGTPNPLAQAGNDATTNHKAENSIGRFKEADVIGHPGGATFSRFASASGYVCPGATFPLVPYFLSTLDAIGWRHGIPEQVYPEALVPGLREVGGIFSGDMWGNLYPRSGFLHQTDDYKTAAVIAQRAGDITTRIGQLHVYLPMRAAPKDGYWPAGELKEGDASTGKWQELTPSLSLNCAVFPNSGPKTQAVDGDYAWALAVIAQRAGDITTRIGQLHVYLPMRAAPKDGYWPAGELKEGDASTGKWQELTPSLSLNCAVFPNSGPKTQAVDGDYAWALWRPYSCCQRKGQIFLGSTDFQ
ncbi:TIGR03756 family integrating conjugative element protein [Pseudomonas aeruginosa]